MSVVCRLGAVMLLLFFSLTGIASAQYQNGIPVLLYHHVNDNDSDMPALTTSPAEFERQIEAMYGAGFRTIAVDDLIAYMQGEKVSLPDKPVVITFDDGYADNYTYAFPIMKKYGFTATIFMVGVNFDRSNRLSTTQIREMTAAGFTIGGHTMTHPDLTSLAGAELANEVAGCKTKAEQATHKPVRFFAYSGGFYNLPTVRAVENAGYAGAFSVLTGLNKRGFDNVYFMRRIPIFSFTDFDRLLVLLNENRPKTSLLDYDPTLPL